MSERLERVPFTFAHPAAVVPLVRRRRLNAVALVAGSMAPDFEYFVRFRLRSDISHTWLGLAVFTIPMALALTGLYWLLEPSLRRLWPERLRQRIPRCADMDPVKWGPGVLLASATIGGVTHTLWDGLTHAHGTFVRRIAWFRQVHVPMPPQLSMLGEQVVLYRVIQHASTALGLVALAVFVLCLPPRISTRPTDASDRRLRAFAYTSAALLALVAAYLPTADLGTRVVRGIDGVLVGIVATCLLNSWPFSRASSRTDGERSYGHRQAHCAGDPEATLPSSSL